MAPRSQPVRGADLHASSTGARLPSPPPIEEGATLAVLEEDPALGAEDLSPRPEWQLACRIAASRWFAKSDLLPRFLLYVCEQELLGRGQELNEQHIGTHIFNRAPDYNPGEDNIVRSYARLLRKRLDAYFAAEGAEEPLRLHIPRGGYVPVFEATSLDSGDPAKLAVIEEDEGPPGAKIPVSVSTRVTLASGSDVITPTQSLPARPRSPWVYSLLGVAVGILLTVVGWYGTRLLQRAKPVSPAHALWMELFQPGHNTLIVPSDSGFGILQNITRHLVGVEEYASGDFLASSDRPVALDEGNFNDLRQQRYTSVVDLNVTAMLTRLPEFSAAHAEVRFARGIAPDELKGPNLILIGSSHTNPWVSLFEKKLNFRLVYLPEVDRSYVLNVRPEASEQQSYSNGAPTNSSRTYGTVAFLPGLDGTSHVLVIQGLNMAATQAAADSLSNQDTMRSILTQARRSDGTLRPFEYLLETSSVGATAPDARILATRFY